MTARAWLRSAIFAVAFYGGSVFFVLLACLCVPFSRRAVLSLAVSWARFHRICARLILGLKVVVQGELHDGQVLYALRHESFFEALDLPCLLGAPPVIFAKAELMNIPLWGLVAARYGIVPVERGRGASALRAMGRAARAAKASGRDFALFPEGTRVRAGQAPRLRSGLYGMYRVLNLPVVPVAVDSGRLYQRRPKRPGIVTYRFGEAIPPGLPRQELEARVHAGINALNL